MTLGDRTKTVRESRKVGSTCWFGTADDGQYAPQIRVLPRGAGAADAAADLASHRSPSDASRDRGCRDLGRLAGVLPAGARSNLAHVASGPVSPGPQRSGPVSPGPPRPGPVAPGPRGAGPRGPGPRRPGPESPGPVGSGPVGPGAG